MRKIVSAGLVVLLLGAAPAPAQEQPGGWAGKLFVDNGRVTLSHDFGTIPRGAMVTHKFPVTNIYAVPLTFDRVSTSCGCVEVVSYPKELKSRESGFIVVSMDSRRMPSPTKTVSVYISVNHPQYRSTTTLNVTGSYRSDVVLNSPNGQNGGLAQFGSIAKGQTPVQKLDLEYAGVANWQATGIVAPETGPVTASIAETYRQPGQGSQAGKVGYSVTLSVKKDAAPGTYRSEVVVQTNDRATPAVPVPYELTILAPLSATVKKLDFGAVKTGDEKTISTIIQSGSTKPFSIRVVDGLGDGLSVVGALPTPAKTKQPLTFKLRAAKAGPINKTLIVRTDDGDSSVEITVDATVTE